MDSQKQTIQLNVVAPTQKKLNACPSTPADLAQWAKALPLANTGETARQLYYALSELNKWQASPSERLALIEVLRPFVYLVCEQLGKHFLQNPLSLSDKQIKVAQLMQALQKHLLVGYKLAIAHHLSLKSGLSKNELELAIHRALSETGACLLTTYQLYQRPAKYLWLELNQLYLLAEQLNVTSTKIEDKQRVFTSHSSILDVFCIVHLLSAAKPNNLRKQDLGNLYGALQLWASYCTVDSKVAENTHFVVDLSSDQPMLNQHALDERSTTVMRAVHVNELVRAFKTKIANPTIKEGIVIPKAVDAALIRHVLQAWGSTWSRASARVAKTGSLELCLGLTALHYFCAEQKNFEESMLAIRPYDYNNDFSQETSVQQVGWSQGFDVDTGDAGAGLVAAVEFQRSEPVAAVSAPAFPIYRGDIINASATGYSIFWRGEIPSNLLMGELLGIRNAKNNAWSVGVIRWIQQSSANETQVGIEILAQKAMAGAAKVLHKTGQHSPFMRALLLPGNKAKKVPTSLLVSKLPFVSGDKVELLFAILDGRFMLSKNTNSTNSFNQFQFRKIKIPGQIEPSVTAESNEGFASLWKSL